MTASPLKPAFLSVAMFSLIPVPERMIPEADRRNSAAALRWLPLLGAFLGLVGAAVGLIFWHPNQRYAAGSPLLGASVSIVVLVLLNRGLHLDGLADVADGLGSRRQPEQALAIMKKSDIGPFGVAAAMLTLLLQIGALNVVYEASSVKQSIVLLVAVTALGRYGALLAAGPGLTSARPGGFGDLVAGSARLGTQVVIGLLLAAGAFGLARLAAVPTGSSAWLLVALLGGAAAAQAMLRHCVRRFGGVTGDVFGAVIETGMTVSLLVLAAGASWVGTW